MPKLWDEKTAAFRVATQIAAEKPSGDRFIALFITIPAQKCGNGPSPTARLAPTAGSLPRQTGTPTLVNAKNHPYYIRIPGKMQANPREFYKFFTNFRH